MSKGDEKQQRASVRPSEEEYFHQCQRGRLLEILSLMEKDVVEEKCIYKSNMERHGKQRRIAEVQRTTISRISSKEGASEQQ